MFGVDYSKRQLYKDKHTVELLDVKEQDWNSGRQAILATLKSRLADKQTCQAIIDAMERHCF